jgi:hypothetical protein
LQHARNLRDGREREVWDCRFLGQGGTSSAILTLFKPGSLESVNTSLLPAQVALKCALAMGELPALDIPTPRLLGHTSSGPEAAVLCLRVEPAAWNSALRPLAARILARLHNLAADCLSPTLQELARISDPRESRTSGGLAPASSRLTLVHGDFFSANLLPTGAGLCVIDWETFAWGDPMWDLGFLIGADRDLAPEEVEATVAGYAALAPVDRPQLQWHARRWAAYWQQHAHREPIRTGNQSTSERPRTRVENVG